MWWLINWYHLQSTCCSWNTLYKKDKISTKIYSPPPNIFLFVDFFPNLLTHASRPNTRRFSCSDIKQSLSLALSYSLTHSHSTLSFFLEYRHMNRCKRIGTTIWSWSQSWFVILLYNSPLSSLIGWLTNANLRTSGPRDHFVCYESKDPPFFRALLDL